MPTTAMRMSRLLSLERWLRKAGNACRNLRDRMRPRVSRQGSRGNRFSGHGARHRGDLAPRLSKEGGTHREEAT